MNYRHAYHAGNFADVLKHVVLCLLLERLARKPAGYLFLDTHAGRGRYPLADPTTERAQEYRRGILPLLTERAPPAPLARYLALVRELGWQGDRLIAYPGSPLIAARLLREQDRAALCELEPGEAAALRREFHGDERVGVHERDGYEALTALVPPPQRRGLVLIDPPYELAEEYTRLEAALDGALRRWPTGCYAVWYPITQDGAAARFRARRRTGGVRRQLCVELALLPEDAPGGLNGAGMLLVNPPWQSEEALRQVLPWLAGVLGSDGARGTVFWLVAE